MWSGRAERLIVVDAPLSCTGVPDPQVFAGEGRVVFTYRLAPLATGGAAGDDVSAVVIARRPCISAFGPPNDEALRGHRLYSIGLKHYSSFEVENSTWIAELEACNSVHPYHRKERYRALRHYIFTFHDSTLELVAEGLDWTTVHRSPADALWEAVAGLRRES